MKAFQYTTSEKKLSLILDWSLVNTHMENSLFYHSIKPASNSLQDTMHISNILHICLHLISLLRTSIWPPFRSVLMGISLIGSKNSKITYTLVMEIGGQFIEPKEWILSSIKSTCLSAIFIVYHSFIIEHH